MTTNRVLLLSAVLVACAGLIWVLRDAPTTQSRRSAGAPETRRQPDTPARRTAQAEPLEDQQAGAQAPGEAATSERARPSKQGSPRSETSVARRAGELPGGFDRRRLSDLGYDPDTIRYIETRWQEYKQEETALAEQSATREWVPPKRRNAQIKRNLRTDLGDEYYDALLYATDQPNRARIGNVIGTSPAAAAGLRIKDVVLRYDGERVFEPDDATRLSENSEPGKFVELWIRRDGEELELYLEGGPLGVRYFPLQETPAGP